MDDDVLDLEELVNSPVTLPVFKNPFPLDDCYVPQPVIVSSDGQIADAADFAEVNRQIDALRIALYKTSRNLTEASRRVSEAKLAYDRAYNRAYLSMDAKTDQMRKAYASLMTESLNNKLVSREAVYNDLNRRIKMMQFDLNSLQMLSYNLRKEADTAR